MGPLGLGRNRWCLDFDGRGKEARTTAFFKRQERERMITRKVLEAVAD